MCKESRIESFADSFREGIASASRSDLREVAKEICSLHPTHQQSAMQLFMECVAIWAEKNATRVGVDQRNDLTCLSSAIITEVLGMDQRNPGQVFVFIDGRPALPFV